MAGQKLVGWDTIGVTSVGLLADGRVKREFTGTDGQKRNIFVPLNTLAQELLTLQQATAAARERGITPKLTVGDKIDGSGMIKVESVLAGKSADGSEVAIVIETIDKLPIRLLTDRGTAETLRDALSAVLGQLARPAGKVN